MEAAATAAALAVKLVTVEEGERAHKTVYKLEENFFELAVNSRREQVYIEEVEHVLRGNRQTPGWRHVDVRTRVERSTSGSPVAAEVVTG